MTEVDMRSPTRARRVSRLLLQAHLGACLAALAGCKADEVFRDPILKGRAVLPAATFAEGPASGAYLGGTTFNGQVTPFTSQPVQGFSGVVANGDGSFLAVSDNGYGSIENSADYHQRAYTLRPEFKTRDGGSGGIQVVGFIELKDPHRRIPWTITNEFTTDRVLTGADIDLESVQRAPDGTLWFGDEFGPFLLHTDTDG